MRPIALAVLLALAACGESESDRAPVVNVKENDKAMNAATERARASIDQFAAALQSPAPKQADFSLKAKFEEGGKVEHLWINDVKVKGDGFVGKVGNEPRDLRRVRLGLVVTIPKERVSDWMYIEDGRLVGGYTMRLLRNRMSPPERKEFDSSVPFKID